MCVASYVNEASGLLTCIDCSCRPTPSCMVLALSFWLTDDHDLPPNRPVAHGSLTARL